MLDAQEVEMLTCGLSPLSTSELHDKTAYMGAYSKTGAAHTVIQLCVQSHHQNVCCQVIIWLWELVDSLDLESRTRMFQFIFGATAPPNLDDPEAKLLWVNDTEDKIPSANPAKRMLLLPMFKSKQDLAYNLRLAIELDVIIELNSPVTL